MINRTEDMKGKTVDGTIGLGSDQLSYGIPTYVQNMKSQGVISE